MKLCEVAEILFSFPEKSIAEMHNTENWLTSVCLKAENEVSGSKSANWLPESAPTTHEGDIIIKRIQPLYVNYIDNNYVGYKVGQNLAIIRAKSKIEPKYLAYVLEKNIDKIYEDITGTTIPAIRKEGFAKLEIGQLLIDDTELFLLVSLSVESPNHFHARKVLPGYPVDGVEELLDDFETWNEERDETENDPGNDDDRGSGQKRQLSTRIDDLANCPDGHDRGFDELGRSKGDDHLDLRNVVCRPCQKGGGREILDVGRIEVGYMIENSFSQVIVHQRGNIRRHNRREGRRDGSANCAGQHQSSVVEDIVHHVRRGRGTGKNFDDRPHEVRNL